MGVGACCGGGWCRPPPVPPPGGSAGGCAAPLRRRCVAVVRRSPRAASGGGPPLPCPARVEGALRQGCGGGRAAPGPGLVLTGPAACGILFMQGVAQATLAVCRKAGRLFLVLRRCGAAVWRRRCSLDMDSKKKMAASLCPASIFEQNGVLFCSIVIVHRNRGLAPDTMPIARQRPAYAAAAPRAVRCVTGT